jgi:hypothetical protein
MCNLVYFFKLGDDRDDRWYRDERLRAELEVLGVRKITSWRTMRVDREPDPIVRPLNNYDRMTEVRFESLEAAERALCSHTSIWSQENRTGLERYEAIVVADEPEFDLLRHAPAPQYRYMSLPIEWSQGKPPDIPEPETTKMAKFMYFFGYRDGVELRHAEDWYLGHHTREGKQLPGIMRYVTWRRRPLPQLSQYLPDATSFVRYTELCFETFDTWVRVCYEEGPKWVRSPRYGEGLWGNYKCFFIPDEPDLVLMPDGVAVG